GSDYITDRTTLKEIVLDGVNSSEVVGVYDYQVTLQYTQGDIHVWEISGGFLMLFAGTEDSIYIEGIRGYIEQPVWKSEPDWSAFGSGISLVFDDKTVSGSSWQTVFGRPHLDFGPITIPSAFKTALADHEAEKSQAPDMEGIPGGLDGGREPDDETPDPRNGTSGPDMMLTSSIGSSGNETFDGGAGNDTISFAGAPQAVSVNLASGTASGADIGQDVIRNIENVIGGNGDDTIAGDAGDNSLDGGAAGSDSIDGGDGSDTVVFALARSQYSLTLLASGAVRVSAASSVDVVTNVEYFSFSDRIIAFSDLTFDQDDDTGSIVGTAGDDTIVGTLENDTLRGGLGNDRLEGGAGSDTYRYRPGDGHDTIEDWADPTSTDVLELGAGISPGSVTVGRGSADIWDVVLGFGNDDSVTIKGGFFAGSTVIEQVHFKDNTVWAVSDLRQIHLSQKATAGDDTIEGFIDVNDLIHGAAGNDTIYAFSGNDTIYGDAANDTIFGEDGNDVIIGGTGNDFMVGGAGSDVFVLNADDGEDWINDFEVGVDKLDLRSVSSLRSFSDVTASAAEWVAGSTWIYTSANTYVRLEGVALADLQASDFLFA
ncbi:calcium-binding protein, partial [Rhizobium sp. FKY42]|uniref:calcium-binding protein n=1 Tax=Rhizobium sp. FKY42 TaxID=2562310 RepID=UPI001980A35E